MNALWVIVIMILWIATLGLLYVTNNDVAKQLDAAAAAEARRTDMEMRYDQLNASMQTLSEIVGYRDPASAVAKADPAAIDTALTAAKSQLGPSLGAADTQVSLERALATALADRQSAWAQAAQAATDHQNEVNLRKAAEDKAAQVQSTYQAQVASLNQQLADAQAAADQQAKNDQDRIDDVVAQNGDLDARARQAEQDLGAATESHRKDVARLDATISSVGRQRAQIAPAEPDGSILQVSEGGAVAWIDVGNLHGLRNGTRFELLRRGRSGELVPRGEVEVREVSADTAMVGLLGEPSPYDPMLPGDLVRSPTFSKSQVLHFYLLGEFPLSLSKEFVGQRLAQQGGVVDDSLRVTTDVLVLGDKNLAEGDDAVALTETEEYRMADRVGMRIVRLADLGPYLRN